MASNLLQTLTTLMEDAADRLLARSILGSDCPLELVAYVEGFCNHRLGLPAALCLYAGFSVGASFGLQLLDGRQVFLKIHRPEPSGDQEQLLAKLKGVAQAQSYLQRGGFPCPEVWHEPEEHLGRLISVSSYAAVGHQENAHNPAIRLAMAQTFAEHIARLTPLRQLHGFSYADSYNSPRLYPEPHNALFDFSLHQEATAWVDEIARRCQRAVAPMGRNLVLGHAEWSMKNMRFAQGEVAMVYDWDSLCLEDEAHLLGIAAATFPTTWELPVLITPSQDEASCFVAEYAAARGQALTMEERRRTAACATYVMCYTARCELALSPDPTNPELDKPFTQALRAMQGQFYIRY